MRDSEICADWLNYVSRFPTQWGYFKKARQYANQTSTVEGKLSGTNRTFTTFSPSSV